MTLVAALDITYNLTYKFYLNGAARMKYFSATVASVLALAFFTPHALAQKAPRNFEQLSQVAQILYNKTAPVDYVHIPPAYMPSAVFTETYSDGFTQEVRFSVAPRDGTLGTTPIKKGTFITVGDYGGNAIHVHPVDDPVRYSRENLLVEWNLPPGQHSVRQAAEEALSFHETLSRRVMRYYSKRLFFPKTHADQVRIARLRSAFYEYAYLYESFYTTWLQRHDLSQRQLTELHAQVKDMRTAKEEITRDLDKYNKRKPGPKSGARAKTPKTTLVKAGGLGVAVSAILAPYLLESMIEEEQIKQTAEALGRQAASQTLQREEMLETLKKEPRLAVVMLDEDPQVVLEAVETPGEYQPALAAALLEYADFAQQSKLPGTAPFQFLEQYQLKQDATEQ